MNPNLKVGFAILLGMGDQLMIVAMGLHNLRVTIRASYWRFGNVRRRYQYEGEKMGFFINLRTALTSITTRGGGLQHRVVTAYLLAFLLSSLGMVAGCGSSSSLFTCFPSSTQTWSPPSANIYAQTEDLGGQDTGNVHTDDPAQVDQTRAADCARQLLAKLPSGITTVQVALDNMYINDEVAVADEFVKQLPGSLLQSLVQTRPGRLLVFHVFLDVTGEDAGAGPEPTGPAGDSATAQKLNQMLLASFPDFQRLYNQPWLGDPIVQAAALQHGTSFQTLAGGNGPYRFDDFTIIIQHMPPGLTPQEFLSEMAQDMNKAANDQQFNDLSTFKWPDTSHPPMIGDINDINFGSAWGLPAPGVPSPVMLVEKADTHFVFQTLQGHILYGSREFGFYALPDGHVLLYTRAISRDSSILSHFGGVAGHANEPQVRTWTNFMIGVCNEMQRRGGSCNPQNPDEGEQSWTRRLNLSSGNPGATTENPLGKVDWTKAVTETDLGCNGPTGPNNGELVDEKQFADVTGDGKEEAFVAVACRGITESWPDRLEVFDGASDPAHPRRIATLLDYQDGTDGTNGNGLRIQSIMISGKMVTVVSDGWTPGECFACGDQQATDTFTWNGSGFTRGPRSVVQAKAP